LPGTAYFLYLAIHRKDDWPLNVKISVKGVIPANGFLSNALPVYAAPAILH
jgi:hypothetical protein